MNFVAGVPIGFLWLSTAGGERHIGQDGQGRAGQLRGHVLVVVILAAELPSRQGVMHTLYIRIRRKKGLTFFFFFPNPYVQCT